MQKVIGSVLILLASTAIGIAKGRDLQRYLGELESLKQLFLMLKSEIKYTKAPLGEAFSRIGRKRKDFFGEWMISLAGELEERAGITFFELWKKSIENVFQKSCLKEADIAQLKSMGMNMGCLDEEMQLGTIDLYMEQLEITICRRREELQAKKRLCNCLGVMGGIFLVILFI